MSNPFSHITSETESPDALIGMKDGHPIRVPVVKRNASGTPSGGGLAEWSDASGTGLVRPDGSISTSVASKLVALYEAQRAEDERDGPILLARSRLSAADTPTITGSASNPSTDGVDPGNQRITLAGAVATGDFTNAQKLAARRWMSGFSMGLRLWEQISFRASSSLGQFGVNGNQNQDVALGYGINNNGVYLDFTLFGDAVFINMLGGFGVQIWVNNNKITGAGVVSTGATHNTGIDSYQITSNGWMKLKFSTEAERRITILHAGAAGFADVWAENTATVLPWNEQKLRWLHFGDSFSQTGTGGGHFGNGLDRWMHTAFGGWDVNFINAAEGGTSFANTDMNLPGAAPVSTRKPSIAQQWFLHGSQNDPDVVSLLIGHNDGTNNEPGFRTQLSLMLADIRRVAPRAVVVVFGTNWSPGLNAVAAQVEANIASVVAQIPGVFFIPLQTNPSGPFMRGTGRVGATTGVGNSDLFTHTDNTHPSAAGHRAYGQMMARRLYSALKGTALG